MPVKLDFDPQAEDFKEFAALKWRLPAHLSQALEILERLRLLSSYGGGDPVQCTIVRGGFVHTLTNEWEIVGEARWALQEAGWTPADAAALIVRSLAILADRLHHLGDPEHLRARGWDSEEWAAVREAAAAAAPRVAEVAEALAPVATAAILQPEPAHDFWTEHYACQDRCTEHRHPCTLEAGHAGRHKFICDRW